MGSDDDFEAQYAKVADDAGGSPAFGPLFGPRTFDEKLTDLCYDIMEAYEEGSTGLSDMFREWEDELRKVTLEEFPVFHDAASIDYFGRIMLSLESAAACIRDVKDYGLADLISLFQHWEGTAADNFADNLKILESTIGYQLGFVGDVGATATHFEELMKRTRVDSYGLAEELMSKVDPPSSGSDLSTVLLVAGLIAAGVATFGAGPLVGVAGAAAAIEFGTGAMDGVLQVQNGLTTDEVGDRSIRGDNPDVYVPSCQERIDEIRTTGILKAETVMGALADDMKSPDIKYLYWPRSEVIGMTKPDNGRFRSSDGFRVDRVADLRKAGDGTLPVMAQSFEEASKSVELLTNYFSAGIGNSVVGTTGRNTFYDAADVLMESFTQTRDALYEAGVALTDIADNYARAEARHTEMMEAFQRKMDNSDMGKRFPKYKPAPEAEQPPSSRPRVLPGGEQVTR